MSSAWTSGSTRRWRTIRAAVLARDAYRCRAHLDGWCDRQGARPHTCELAAPLEGGHVHHTRGRRAGDDPAHLVAACAPCNLAIGDPATGGGSDPAPRPATKWR